MEDCLRAYRFQAKGVLLYRELLIIFTDDDQEEDFSDKESSDMLKGLSR
jgi:hypothetical protein